jgi:threonine/homoserine/homoserine lactone efflux protein
MSLEFYLAYVAACIVLVIVPGPTVTLIVANSLRYGTSAGLINVAGTQLGLGLMMLVVIVGLASIIEIAGFWFDWLRLLGAAYLIWLGVKLFTSRGALDAADDVKKPRGGFFLQGFLVMMSNPKVLLFFGAFIPQFVTPEGDTSRQVVLLGATAMIVASLSDGAYAVLSGRVGKMLSSGRLRALSVASRVLAGK